VDKAVLEMAGAEFSSAAENSINAWWYQNGHSSGRGKPRGVYLTEKPPRQRKVYEKI